MRSSSTSRQSLSVAAEKKGMSPSTLPLLSRMCRWCRIFTLSSSRRFSRLMLVSGTAPLPCCASSSSTTARDAGTTRTCVNTSFTFILSCAGKTA
jgi:hypothetical protein